MKIGSTEWIGHLRKNQPELLLGFTALDSCDRCGAAEDCSWINVEDPRNPSARLLLSIYLCRGCIWEALRRTYEDGEIAAQHLLSYMTDRERKLMKVAPLPGAHADDAKAPRPHVRAMPRTRERGQSVKLRFDVLKRDGYRCQLCGSTAKDDVRLEVDHKVPHSKGGLHTLENLWVLCWPCNRGKSDRDL